MKMPSIEQTVQHARLFIGLQLDLVATEQLVHATTMWRSQLPRGIFSWHDPQYWHITLYFLGSVPMEAIPSIAEHLRISAESLPAFKLTTHLKPDLLEIASSGLSSPALALAIDLSPALMDCFASVGQGLKNNGIDLLEREFTPHITIAKGDLIGCDLAALTEIKPIEIDIENITIFRSFSDKDTSCYVPLLKVPLG